MTSSELRVQSKSLAVPGQDEDHLPWLGSNLSVPRGPQVEAWCPGWWEVLWAFKGRSLAGGP